MTVTAPRLLLAALLTVACAAQVPPVLGQAAPLAPDTVLPPPPEPAPGGTGAAPVQGPRPSPAAGAPWFAAPQPASPFPPAGPEAGLQPGATMDFWGLFDWAALRPQQFFIDKEFEFLKPHLKAALTETVTFPGGFQTTVQPPTAQVNWTEAPRLEIGWIPPENLGLFALSWRGFADDGRQLAFSRQGIPYSLRTRLDLNEGAFDYGTLPYTYAPRWFVSGRLGMAAADVFFDNSAVNSFQSLYASNNFVGAGPHIRGDLWHEFQFLPGLSIFAQPDLMVLVGFVHQNYNQTIFNPYGPSPQGVFSQRKTQTVPVLTFRTGLAYKPPSWTHLHFLLGYEFEDWWSVGQIPGQASRGQLTTNGIFVRLLANF